MWTQFQCFGSGATIFLVVPVKGRLSLQLPKGNCVQARSSFCLEKIMNPLKMKYKGAAPLWEWPPLAIIIYISILTLIAFHEELYDLFIR